MPAKSAQMTFFAVFYTIYTTCICQYNVSRQKPWLSRKDKFAYHRFLQSKEFDEVCSNPYAESFKAALERFQDLFFLFEELKSICKMRKRTPIHAYWMTFFDITQVVLDYVKSIHVGNWELHLTAFECMLPWFHAYDCQNYSPFFLPLLQREFD